MGYRFMRIITFFDLPTITTTDRREYQKFRKFLIKNGFIMMQESVYCKLALNTTTVNTIMENIRKNRPAAGLVQVISITEKQFSQFEFIVGESQNETIDNDERLLVI